MGVPEAPPPHTHSPRGLVIAQQPLPTKKVCPQPEATHPQEKPHLLPSSGVSSKCVMQGTASSRPWGDLVVLSMSPEPQVSSWFLRRPRALWGLLPRLSGARAPLHGGAP